jgi:uncharacterized protein
MPSALTYPGVYIEEVPSGVRTIMGVPTSVVAFVGRAARGPVNEPTSIFGFGDFERIFGGLDQGCPLSFAVRSFFLNGGGQAVIVRVTAGTGGNAAVASTISIPVTSANPLVLSASSPGVWGDKIYVKVNRVGLGTDASSKDPAQSLGLSDNTALFNLQVALDPDMKSVVEDFRNLAFADCARRVDRVLAAQSAYLRVANPSTDIPASGSPLNLATTTLGGGVATSGGTPGGNGSNLSASSDYLGSDSASTGMYALNKTDIFNLLCVPPDSQTGDLPSGVVSGAASYCSKRRAMLIVDPPSAWGDVASAQHGPSSSDIGLTDPNASRNSALFFPRIKQANPLREGQIETFVPCGAVAGVFARTDVARGIWKAPAGIDAAISDVQGLSVSLTDGDNGLLNPLGVNCLRNFPGVGTVIWGARTCRGADQLSDEYKYVPVRRLALFIEESLFRGTKWVVFEPNDERLWSQIRLNVGAFMQNLFRQGAFQGQSAREAYFVKCDKDTTIQNDIDRGIVNVVVGFAPLKPAEFVVIKLQQMAGQVSA